MKTVLGPGGFPKKPYGEFVRKNSTWTLVLSLDPNWVITDPGFVRVVGFISNRDVPIMPVTPNMTQ